MSTLTASRFSITTKTLLSAFGAASSVVPTRSPKPILQNVKLAAGPEGSVLMATDLEIGLRQTLAGVTVDSPTAVILPTARMGSILRTVADAELEFEAEDDKLIVRGERAEFKLTTEAPDLFPDVADFDAEDYAVIDGADLRRAINRTVFATDVDSTRYALGGCLFEFAPDGESLTLVGTDGRRLATQRVAIEWAGEPWSSEQAPVLPARALKLLARLIADEDGPVHLDLQSNLAVFRVGGTVMTTRLVEGRFPAYHGVFPPSSEVKIPLEVAPLRLAVEQASIVTSDESRGVDFAFAPGVLRLASTAADVGSSHVELPIAHEGATVEITFDPRYLMDALKVLADDAQVTAELIDAKNAAVFRTEDRYVYVVMPLTRDR